MVSLWGRLRRTVMATSAPRNSARRTIANIRSPMGMVDPCVPGLAGLLMGSNSPILLFSPGGFAVVAASAAVAGPTAVGDFCVLFNHHGPLGIVWLHGSLCVFVSAPI